jgi:hypothetical protein
MKLVPDKEFVLVCQQPLDWFLDPPVQNESRLAFLGVKPDHLEPVIQRFYFASPTPVQ